MCSRAYCMILSKKAGTVTNYGISDKCFPMLSVDYR
uniref:Uncharacterized protein n=1 Tax=Siphoviridae sp. ct3tr1 TaxID=2827773 RepID=A0A8S5TQA2_9CAUD|nr:MAG TPA: hypothetical protein [Siphoviridae sp. ct3tr1]